MSNYEKYENEIDKLLGNMTEKLERIVSDDIYEIKEVFNKVLESSGSENTITQMVTINNNLLEAVEIIISSGWYNGLQLSQQKTFDNILRDLKAIKKKLNKVSL